MSFIKNEGQWLPNIEYNAQLNFGNIYFEKDNFTFILIDNEKHNHNSNDYDRKAIKEDNHTIQGHHFKIKFLNANEEVTFKQENKSKHYYNYFIGDDPAKWASNVHAFKAIEYQNLYDGIDMKVYGAAEHMKYEYYVAPYKDPNQIQVQYLGVNNIHLKNGHLVYSTTVTDIKELKPIVYQLEGLEKRFIDCKYVLNKKTKTVQFEFPNSYDQSKELIIDPSLVFASYTGSTLNNFGFTATYDNEGNLFGGGIIFGNAAGASGYPSLNSFNPNDVTSGSNEPNFNNGFTSDIAISKFNTDGTSLLYSTLIGGNANEQPQSLIADSLGNLYIYGRSNSTDFPTSNSAYDDSLNGNLDIIITKLSPGGNVLMSSTYIGGSEHDGSNMSPAPNIYNDLKFNYADDGRGEIILDENGNIYVASSTQSTDMFSNMGAFQNSFGGGAQDACVFKMNNDLSTLIWGSYLGGSNNDAGYSLKLDGQGNLFVTGGTNSTDFPGTNNGLLNSYQGGRADGFIAKLDSNGSSLSNSTYLGTTAYDQSFFLEIDEFNDVFVFGQTVGAYPIVGTVYNNPNGTQFIHKLNNDLNTTLFSTVFGNGDSTVNISPTAFLVDFCGNIYLSGWGGTTNTSGNTLNMPTTPDGIQLTTDGSDLYLMVLDRDAENLLYATYYGGDQTVNGGGSGEHVDGGTSRFDRNGIVYQAVCASCNSLLDPFPATAGSWSQSNNSSGGCNLGVLKMELYVAPTIIEVDANPRLTGCVPLLVEFESTLVNVNSVSWDFDDGMTSNLENPTHLFTDTGMYIVQLIGLDTTLCNFADTAYLQILVEDDSLSANFVEDLSINCSENSISLHASNYATTEYLWNLGDGNSFTTDSVFHVYNSAGVYDIELFVSDSTSCELLDSMTLSIEILPSIESDFLLLDTFGCLPFSTNFVNQTNILTDSLFWDFGDGNSSTNLNPTHTYQTEGNYTISLFALDTNTCNVSDTAFAEIAIQNDSLLLQINIDTLFFDCDSLHLRFSVLNPNLSFIDWDFGNGVLSTDSSTTVSFLAGNYNVSLQAEDSTLVCNPNSTWNFDILLLPEIRLNTSFMDTFGCSPLTLFFEGNLNFSVDSFSWDFGDGNTGSSLNENHIYNMPGAYIATFLAIDSSTCNIIDSINIPINVLDDFVLADVEIQQNAFACDSLQIIGTSNNIGSTYFWDFGNGNTSTEQNVTYSYTEYGNYEITYIVFDTNVLCKPLDTLVYSIFFDSLQAQIIIEDDFGCLPFTLDYNSPIIAQNYFWDFGNGSSSNSMSGQNQYTSNGNFELVLLVEDSAYCNVFDTAFANIIVDDQRVIADYDFDILSNCDSLLEIMLNNQSILGQNYEWYFDGANINTAEEPGVYTFSTIGTHEILLIAFNDTLCNQLDTVIKTFELLPNVTAHFEVEDNCEKKDVYFQNNSLQNGQFLWDFGDGKFSDGFNPKNYYQQSGTYLVSLTHIDSFSCNISDTFTQEIDIIEEAIAQFETDSINYLFPDDVSFFNQSLNFNEFLWSFGDGTTETNEENPVHSYDILYEIEPCLSVQNEYCADTVCQKIFIDFIELIGVPNAFSPNNDGVNDIIYVEGLGIENMNFKIFNRWGELVFESNDQSLGWNGVFKGVPQEVEVYTYTLDAQFINDKSVRLQGNISLLR